MGSGMGVGGCVCGGGGERRNVIVRVEMVLVSTSEFCLSVCPPEIFSQVSFEFSLAKRLSHAGSFMQLV